MISTKAGRSLLVRFATVVLILDALYLSWPVLAAISDWWWR